MINFFSYSVTIYSVLCLAIGLLSLSLTYFVYFANPKSNINRTYAAFCACISVWLIATFFSSSNLFDLNFTVLIGKIVYTAVALMPTLALHFSIEYLGTDIRKVARYHLKIVYAITTVFICLVWTSRHFISGAYSYSWGHYPKTGFLHYLHTAFVLGTATYIIALFKQGMNTARSHENIQKYHEYKYLFLAFIFVTLASSDFLHNWGIDFFPIGCIFIALFITCTTYAIFKHELLGISLVIEKSLLYSALVSILTAIYFLSVYAFSQLVGGLTKLHSLPLILAVFTIITLFFKPLERKIQKSLDKLFFKKSLKDVENENLMLLKEIQKTDQMKAVATLAAGMAHEIKNPLTSIKTFAEYLPQKYDDPEFRQKFTRIVIDEVDRVNNIVRQLLDFSRPKELELKLESVTEILDETLNLLSSNLLKNKIEVVKNYKDKPLISVDKNQLKQAFLNLFLNAIQAMPNGGTLTVGVSEMSSPNAFVGDHTSGDSRQEHAGMTFENSRGNDKILITISDTGPGIPKDQIEHIFNPFFTTKEGGTGLGLSIVHGIVTKHEGKISVESAPGAGTTIRVVLKNQN